MNAPAGADEAGPALTFADLSLGYGRRTAVRGVTGTIARGELLALVGPNGTGKSTLLKGIAGEVATFSGRLDRHGGRVRDIAYLPQRAGIDRSFPITVSDFVSMGLWRRTGAWRPIGASGRALIAEALARVGLAGLASRTIWALSGGEMQRVLFARTLAQDSRLILLDEPFAAVDQDTTADLLDLVSAWGVEGRTVVAALHDLDQVRARFPRTLLLGADQAGSPGRPMGWGPTAAVLAPGAIERGAEPAWVGRAAPLRRAEG